MVKEFCQRALKAASAFLNIEKGSILIYTGAFMAVGVGGAAVSIDIGRIVLLRTQMQNRADAGALAGAAQLDSNAGAIERAEIVVEDSMKAYTTASADSGELIILTVTVYDVADDGEYINIGNVSTDDTTARFVRADLEKRTLSFFYAPAVALLTNGTVSDIAELNAYAIAMSDPYVCKAQPLMICNPFETAIDTFSDVFTNDAHIGKGITIKKGSTGGGAWTAGNFGLLNLPEDVDYAGGGAKKIMASLMDPEPQGCYGLNSLATAPGNMVVSVAAGINVRFGLVPSGGYTDDDVNPAPNTIEYPTDRVLDETDALYDDLLTLGDGDWNFYNINDPNDPDFYWTRAHPGVALPDALDHNPSRYQVYLFENGIGYWEKNKKTNPTSIDEPDQSGGWIYVDPTTGADNPDSIGIPVDAGDPDNNQVDGIPPAAQTEDDYERRVLKVAVLNCLTEDFKGASGLEGATGTYIGIFITEEAQDPPGGGILGELIGAVEPATALEFHGNVRLVE
jgi:Flp pilus assembly protein TadG